MKTLYLYGKWDNFVGLMVICEGGTDCNVSVQLRKVREGK